MRSVFTSARSRRSSSRSVVVGPSLRNPSSRSSWRTQRRRSSLEIPSSSDTARCDFPDVRHSSTAWARYSAGYL